MLYRSFKKPRTLKANRSERARVNGTVQTTLWAGGELGGGSPGGVQQSQVSGDGGGARGDTRAVHGARQRCAQRHHQGHVNLRILRGEGIGGSNRHVIMRADDDARL